MHKQKTKPKIRKPSIRPYHGFFLYIEKVERSNTKWTIINGCVKTQSSFEIFINSMTGLLANNEKLLRYWWIRLMLRDTNAWNNK